MTIDIKVNKVANDTLADQIKYEYTLNQNGLSVVCMGLLPIIVNGRPCYKIIGTGIATAPSLEAFDDGQLIQLALAKCEDNARHHLYELDSHIQHMAETKPELLTNGQFNFDELMRVRNLLFYLLSSTKEYQTSLWKSLHDEAGNENETYFYAGLDFTVGDESVSLVVTLPLAEYGLLSAMELDTAKPERSDMNTTLALLEQYHILSHLTPATRPH